jgi:uncharacterized membrane protein YcgQ (UPF0703/DUF1980 family)
MMASRLMQCIVWMAFLSCMLMNGTYKTYIIGWQGWVLISATAIFAILVLFNALFPTAHDHEHHDHDHGAPLDRWLHTVVHMLPLFLFLVMGTTSLSSQQIRHLTHPAPRSALRADQFTPEITAPSLPTTAQPSALPPSLDEPTPPDPTLPVVKNENEIVAPVIPLPLIELYYPKKHQTVERVETIGRLMIPTADELASTPADFDRADLTALLYRYVMTCCAADASPTFVVLRNYTPPPELKDAWVKVRGSWIRPPNLGDMAKIVVESVEAVPEPKEPYLQVPPEPTQPRAP